MENRFENRYGTQAACTATHIYLLPHPSLRPFIAHYTLCPGSGGFPAAVSGDLALIPDASGCLVFSLLDGGAEGRLYGPTTETVVIPNTPATSPLRFFVEFKPGGLFAFTGIPQRELCDRILPLREFVPALDAAAQSAFSRADCWDDFVFFMDAALRAYSPTPPPVLPMLSFLTRSHVDLPVRLLAVETGYSVRHLSRLFHQGVGMGAKSFVRVLRINEAVRRIQASPHSLTSLAQELGYYDQSHFIHDFRSICGVTPGDYLRQTSDFYNEPFKL